MTQAVEEQAAGLSPPDAVARLFDEHGAGLLRYLARRTGPASAEDLVSETFTAALEGLSSFDPARGSERAWLYGIATNLLRHHFRSESRRNAANNRAAGLDDGLAIFDDGAADRVDANRRVRQLAGVIAGLADEDRDVLLLVAWSGLTTAEIAHVLNIPAGTVRSRLHRVRRLVKAAAPHVETEDAR